MQSDYARYQVRMPEPIYSLSTAPSDILAFNRQEPPARIYGKRPPSFGRTSDSQASHLFNRIAADLLSYQV